MTAAEEVRVAFDGGDDDDLCNDHKYWVLKVQVCLSLTSAEPFRLL
jgi:hypothetical protein